MLQSQHVHVLHSYKMIAQIIKQEAHGPHRSPELTAVNMYM